MVKFQKPYAYTDTSGQTYQVSAYNKKEAAKKLRAYHPDKKIKDADVYKVKN